MRILKKQWLGFHNSNLDLSSLTWILLFASCIFFSLINLFSNEYSLISIYSNAADNWLHHRNLYTGDGLGFIYFPQSAILYIPFHVIQPDPLQQGLWRILWMGFMGYILRLFSQKYYPEKSRSLVFFLMSLATILIGADTIRNGQLNIAINTLGLLSLITIYEEKWWLAAILITIGLAIKPTFIVFYLLCFALFKQLRIKLLFMTLLAFIMPFMTAPFSYVMQQYSAAIHNLGVSAHYGAVNPGGQLRSFAQIFNLLEIFGLTCSLKIQTLLRAGFALFTLALAMLAERSNLSKGEKIIYIYGFAVIYLLLFNPRTESNDYIFLAPTFAAYYFQEIFILKNKLQILVAALLSIGLIFHHDLAKLMIPNNTIWLAPFMTLIFGILFIKKYLRKINAYSPEITTTLENV